MSVHFKSVCVGVSAAVLFAVAACQKAPEQKAVAAPEFTLDESKLIQPIRFASGDLDPSKSACVDLSAHVNDKWLAVNPIPADQVIWGVVYVLRERSLQVRKQLAEQLATRSPTTGIEKIVADLWATGMDETKRNADGIAPLDSRLAEIAALKDGASIADYLRKVAARGENPLFNFGALADFKNSAVQMAYAMQGGTSLPDKTYYFDADKKSIREAFVTHIAKVLELSGVPTADAATQAKQVMAFETRLAKASKSSEELARDFSLYYNPVKLADADKLTPNFSWTAFIDAQPLAKPEVISLSVPAFHQEVSKMLKDVPVAEWQSYLRFHLVDGAAPMLSAALVEESFNFYSKTLSGQKEMKALWKRVLGGIEGAAGEAMGQLYVKVAFPPESRERMQKLVDNLRVALKARIENLAWMTPTTKAKALEKLSAFSSKIGYPTHWRDWAGLETSRASYFGNMIAATAFNYRYDLAKVGKPTDKSEWTMTPQTVNAGYNPLANDITFPAAILQPPVFDPEADDAFNYGAIGAVIGHELTHGYDDQGSRFGPTGNFEQWWTPEDAKKFAAFTGALVKQYDGYSIPEGKVNGKLTLGENIADLGGLNVAYDALQRATQGVADPKTDGLTRDQRFFVGYASYWRDQIRPEEAKRRLASDEHAPSPVRANGTPSNVPAFAAAFGCKAGDPMANTDAKRVVIW